MSVTSPKTIIKKIEPNESLCLSSNELDFFYKLLLICESSIIYPKGYHYDDCKLKEFIKEKKINLSHNSRGKTWKGISKESKSNEIQFKNIKGAVCSSLFVQLRHAFAHGYIEKDTNTNILHFQNFYRGECIMDGRMTFKNLSELIYKMLKTKNNEKENL